ncbi:MAG TPA: hypothetical protein VK735_39955 [Pseudonocardia sp.]|nr:hypothetical protein [Pseudonocardia sp.]HTF53659.1 hypothetical protein [Pseudonocardia sp.]
MRTFRASYFGRCLACDDTIEPGDEVGYADDELIHADCDEDD